MAVNTTNEVAAANKVLLIRSTMIKTLQDYARLMRTNLAKEANLIYLTASGSIPFIHQPLLALDVAFVCLICKLSNQPLAHQQFLDQAEQCQTQQEVEIIVKTALIMI